MKLSEELTKRGFIQQSSAPLKDIFDGPSRTIYLGVDPTADSIHAGNFAVYMLLRHLASYGHRVILLIGGGTGLIGDPKPDVERPLVLPEVVKERAAKLTNQVTTLLGSSVTVVNNHAWLVDLSLISFLRDIGKHFTVNELIKKDAIASRLNSESGITYTEFAYPLLQAFDFLELYTHHACTVQIGGSDQWGNIVAGVDLVRKKTGATVYGVTIPLVIDKTTGKKFGKSEGNAIWLDPTLTTPYQFYQFWFNVADENVPHYLRIFSFRPLSEIETIIDAHASNPSLRSAQKALAHDATTLVHGEHNTRAAEEVSNILFGTTWTEPSPEAVAMLQTHAPVIPAAVGDSVVDLLVTSGLASSKREARTFIGDGAISIGNRVVTESSASLTPADATPVTILRRGKKQLTVLMCSYS